MKLRTVLRSLANVTRIPLAALAMLPVLAAAQADGAPRRDLSHYNLEKGLALDGHDPTAYFPEGGGEPTKGRTDLQTTHRGVTYRFATRENRERFLAEPSRFEPAYGGWCAYAMASGQEVEVDPESFLIEDGRLLVFYKGFLNDTRKKWRKQGSATLRPQADAHWSRLSGEDAARDVSHYNLKDGLALKGYDPVAYLRAAPERGAKEHHTSFGGVAYRFASEASRTAFLEDPTAFEPKYGGWCAWAMAQGKKVEVDPEAFVRDEEGLFVFYDAAKRDEWIAARATMKPDGDEHWARITRAL